MGLGCGSDDLGYKGIAEIAGTEIVSAGRAFQVFDLGIGIHLGEEVGEKVIVEVYSHHASGAMVHLGNR